MKKTKYLLGLAIAVIAMLTSCDKDNEGAIYNSDNGAVSFTSSTLNAVTVPSNDPTFEVEIVRGNAATDISGTINVDAKIGNKTIDGITVSGYSFKAGETKTTVKVDVTPLEVGQILNLTLTIADENHVSVGGNISATMKVNKAYNWVSLGTGKFVDNWSSGVEYPVEILKAEGFDRWRVIEPYVESLKNDDGEWGDWIASESAPYIELWLSDGVIEYDEFFLGLNYQADSKSPIYAYHPAAFGINPSFNKFIDDKTIQLAPYYYVPSLEGGWDNTQVEGVIIITLP